MVAWNTDPNSVAIIGGVRSAFAKAGTALKDAHVTDLAQTVMREVLYRAACPEHRVDQVILGNVILPCDAANPARVAAMRAGIPDSVPALTVQRNCASGMEAITQGTARIRSGRCRIVLSAGAESMSRTPLLFPPAATAVFTALSKARSPGQKLAAILKFRPRHFTPQSALVQGLTDPLCQMIMGKTGEVLAHEFAISRDQQDAFALESHRRALHAIKHGHFSSQLTAFYPNTKTHAIKTDIGPRQGMDTAALARLKPLFDRHDGSITVGNACQITDGAAALLLEQGSLARAEGRDILGYIRGCATAGVEPHRMGLGPAFAIDQLLQSSGLSLKDIGLIEINEAFAAQVIACQHAMASQQFCQQRLGRAQAIGEIDPARLNVDGGAIALGHPVGATGTRLVLNLLHAMKRHNVQWGIASLCVAGGQGTAILIERK